MTNTSKTIIFFGTEDFSLAILKSLIDAGYSIAAVATKPDNKRGRGQNLSMPSVKELALKFDIPVWQPNKISDINEDVKKLGSNIAGVLASFGKIIPKSTLDLFNPGIINVHPSLLPLYRGPSPIESAIVNADEQTGVSIIKLVPLMDAGPIYGTDVYQLSGNETQPELYEKLAQVGANLLINLLPSILDESITPHPQDDSKAIYCNLLDKKDSWLDPTLISAETAERLVRAHLTFPKTKIDILGHTIIITECHVSQSKSTDLDIKFRDNNFLSIDKLIAPSGRTMSAKDFLNGYK
jgi:methionyl-tRNA formyltransferase